MEGDTQKLSRGVGWEEREEGEDSWAGLSSACSLTDSTWLTGMPGPSGRNGELGWRVLGVTQTTQDLQWKGSCHSWNTHINKVLAQSRYLPSSSNKYPCTVDACRSLSNCHKYIHWNYDIWSLAVYAAIFQLPFNMQTICMAVIHYNAYIILHNDWAFYQSCADYWRNEKNKTYLCYENKRIFYKNLLSYRKIQDTHIKFRVCSSVLRPSLAQSSIVFVSKRT